jgi:hypothetical protein
VAERERCLGEGNLERAKITSKSADPGLARMFSVLTVAATPSDSLAGAQGIATAVVDDGAATVSPSQARLLRSDLNGRVWVVPATLGVRASTLCQRLFHSRWLPNSSFEAYLAGHGPGLCLLHQPGSGNAPLYFVEEDAACVSADALRGYSSVVDRLNVLGRGRTRLMLVPDHVTAVAFAYVGGRRAVEPAAHNLVTLPAFDHRRPANNAAGVRAYVNRFMPSRFAQLAGTQTVATFTRPKALFKAFVTVTWIDLFGN